MRSRSPISLPCGKAAVAWKDAAGFHKESKPTVQFGAGMTKTPAERYRRGCMRVGGGEIGPGLEHEGGHRGRVRGGGRGAEEIREGVVVAHTVLEEERRVAPVRGDDVKAKRGAAKRKQRRVGAARVMGNGVADVASVIRQVRQLAGQVGGMGKLKDLVVVLAE
jgi:hypothetical protein